MKRLQKIILLGLAMFVLYPTSLHAEATLFRNLEEREKSLVLQTATTRYSHGDVNIDLVGALHIADEEYYTKLNEDFKKYEVLLYEKIGGGKSQNRFLRFLGRLKSRILEPTHYIGRSVMTYLLRLKNQRSAVDYLASNFVHADFTLKEYSAAKKEFARLNKTAKNKKSEKDLDTSFDGGITAVFTRDSEKLKRMSLPVLMRKSVEKKEDYELTIVRRNTKCFSVLDKQIKGGKKNIGIFYGAGHLPDMEQRLLKRGFKKVSHTWRDAWHVSKT